ncbi:NADPH-dependent FMN reductase [Methylobacterium nigriterrae]|uniref:NADPH-dependent FMN reductase n=1 Tax=Methylobacterium nigriterrae TaxID=3127512 RepID=UPI003013EBBB
MPLVCPVILGTVRSDRQGIRAARFLAGQLEGRGHEAPLVDPEVLRLPLLDRMYKEYPAGQAPKVLEDLATLFRRADAFLIVSAEYNHSIPPALSNTLDHFLEEYSWRPSAICCYSAGQFGGVRAAMQLRAMLPELGMPSIPSLLPIPRIHKALDEAGKPAEERLAKAAGRFLDELAWYAEAMRAQRAAGTPY